MENKKRLIDADRLKRHVIAFATACRTTYMNVSEIVEAITKSEAIDAVEVVRCKDCKHFCGFEHCKNGICDVDSVSKRAVYPEDFCSYGERKGNG